MSTTSRNKPEASRSGRQAPRIRPQVKSKRTESPIIGLRFPAALKSVGLSTEIVEVLAGPLAKPEAEKFWARFWAPIRKAGTHWLQNREFCNIDSQSVSDVAFVYVNGPLERGQSAKRTCGAPGCVRHLVAVSA